MVIFKNNLDELLAEGVLSSGIARQQVLQKIRAYLASTPTTTLRAQLSVITNKQELVFLQGAGVPAELQTVFFYVLGQST